MCLAVPMRIVSVEGMDARAEQGGTAIQVRLDFLEDIRSGDYVLIHAGFAIQRIDEAEARETLALLEALR
ncbi:MAG: HypC/HybG/HupF family hydrogenase formation chaperone [Armatimonadetes bacterium]|nr:HypC/HybG/HupF family hydrogenase formation chaperone [Armatimonadota bacterium]